MSLTVSGSSITFPDASVQSTAATGFGFKNRIINGNMALAQRATSATVTAGTGAPAYPCVDRFFVYSTGADVTAAQVAGSGATQYRLQITGAASVTAVGVGQRIEQLNSYDMAGSTATLSVDLANTALSTVTWTASYATTANTFGTIGTPTKTQIATGTFTVGSTVANFSTQISIPAAATTGIEILFTVGAQTSGTFTVGQVQLTKSATVEAFDVRPTGTELALCQRYCWRPDKGSDANNFISTAGSWGSSTNGFFSGSYPVTMRTTPSLTTDTATLSNYAAYTPNGGAFNSITSLSLNVVSNAAMYLLSFGVASGGTAGQFAYFTQKAQTTNGVYFSAEL